MLRWLLKRFPAFVLALAGFLAAVFLVSQWGAAQSFTVDFGPFLPDSVEFKLEDGFHSDPTSALIVVDVQSGPWDGGMLTVEVDASDGWDSVRMNTAHCLPQHDAYEYGFDVKLERADQTSGWAMAKAELDVPDSIDTHEFTVYVRLVFVDRNGETAVCVPPSASPVRFHELPSGEYDVVVTATMSPF